jgi:hypothetical protein
VSEEDDRVDQETRIAIWIVAIIAVAVALVVVLVIQLTSGDDGAPNAQGSSAPSTSTPTHSEEATPINDGVVDSAVADDGMVVDYDRSTPPPAPVGESAELTARCVPRPPLTANPDFYVELAVAMPGGSCWDKEVGIDKTSSRIELLVQYQNLSGVGQEDVNVRAVFPDGVTLVPATTELYNSRHSDGLLLDNNSVDNEGENIGTYADGANAFLRYEAQLPLETDTPCGSSTFTVTAEVKPSGLPEEIRSVDVNVSREC